MFPFSHITFIKIFLVRGPSGSAFSLMVIAAVVCGAKITHMPVTTFPLLTTFGSAL